VAAPITSKSELRAHFRQVRRGLDDRAERSDRIRRTLGGSPQLLEAEVVMLYAPLAGEPDLGPLVDRLVERGQRVVLPEDEPDPSSVDVVVVPGLAFTASGDRLGQGGGWYDRFLSGLRADVQPIGVCFDVQIVDALPVEPHDVRMRLVVTDRQVLGGEPERRQRS